jgi:hypothetical protein
LRWRTFKPRVLARRIKEQCELEDSDYYRDGNTGEWKRRTRKVRVLTYIWDKLLLVPQPSSTIAELTVVKPFTLDVPFRWA